ncbi:unnamed protein product [Closterium sp. NIES-54]
MVINSLPSPNPFHSLPSTTRVMPPRRVMTPSPPSSFPPPPIFPPPTTIRVLPPAQRSHAANDRRVGLPRGEYCRLANAHGLLKIGEYCRLANAHGLLKIGGSDFHGAAKLAKKGGVDLGGCELPALAVQRFLEAAGRNWRAC